MPAVALAANGWNGKTEPNDPGYDVAEHDPVNHCIHDEEWFLYSFIPKCTPLASDPEGASGMSVDHAWKQFTFGRPDVKIAYVEGGVNWHDHTAAAELADRSYLNTGELPLPEHADGSTCAAYDCNGDGQVNVEDYAQDPRIHRPYLNGAQITPEDLILAFGNCQISPQTHRIVTCVPGQHFDNDGNGYANDIAGWNFFQNDNDPATGDSAYEHSDGQMQRAAAEGNNGIAGVGVCPGCTIIPIKAGYEALDTTDRIAQSVYFAVDSGASVIDLLTAEEGYSDLTKAALDYAWRKGVVVIGASNDFDSTDHQEGMFWPREWPGNGLQPNDPSAPGSDFSRTVTSYRERSNETSFGTHALFSTPNLGGSTSESQPTQAGVAALVASEGRDAADKGLIGGPLSAGEVKQVVRETASNIDDPNLGWPGVPGATFNIQYGYGRPNVLEADQAVAANRIPPVPDITGPEWYALYDPTRTSAVPIAADIVARRAHGFDWKVQYALGAQPTEADFQAIASGHSAQTETNGTLAHLDLGQIPSSFWQAPLHFTSDLSSTEQYTVTIRVQATDDRGNMGEDRRSIAVFHDPSLRPGYPRYLGQGKDSEPVLADLQGTGKLDLIFGDANGRVHALDPDTGAELPGWPARTDQLSLGQGATPAGRAGAVPRAYEPVESSPAVGDLLGDGGQDVVVASTTGRLYAFDGRGRLLAGFPRAMGADVASYPVPPPDRPFVRPPSMGSIAAPVLAPAMPGSGTRLTIVQAAFDGRLYAIDGRGHDLPGWPVVAQLPDSIRPAAPYNDVHDYKLVATPTLADLTGDGKYEIVLKSQESAQSNNLGSLGFQSKIFVMALWPDGNDHPGGPFVPGWPAPVNANFDYYGSAQDAITEGLDTASAADVSGNGRDDILQPAGFLGNEALLDSSGNTVRDQFQGPGAGSIAQTFAAPPTGVANDRIPPSSTAAVPIGFTTAGTFAHFGGGLTYLSAGTDLQSMSALLHNGVAQRITNFMRANDAASGNPINGFPAPMMGLAFLTAPAVADVAGDGQPDVINNEDTSNVAAFDQQGQPVPGWPKFTGGWTLWTPAVGDLDGSGHNSVVDLTREGWLFAWNTPGQAAQNQAYSWHQDNWHTGRYGVETRPPLSPRDLTIGGARAGARRLCWTAPGDVWATGTAARYEVRVFSSSPVPSTFAHGLPVVGAPAPAAAGTRQCADVPARARLAAVRAVGHSGLISAPAVAPLTACTSARRITLKVPRVRGGRVLSAALYVDGRRVRRVSARRRSVGVSLAGRPGGPVLVEVRAVAVRHGHRVTVRNAHRFVTCVARRVVRHRHAARRRKGK